jgi:parallel beta-helix repeat protein
MEKAKRRKLVILVLSLAALVAFPPLAMAAGSLEPSAPPGPVMKSLDEVEPRIPIKASNLPMTIAQRGSYYLTQDINFTDTAHHAITVGCNDVTIDLKGYTITGPNSTSYSGIYLDGCKNVEICNGTVRDFYSGILDPSNYGEGYRIINIRVVSNTNNGIQLFAIGSLVKDCTSLENGHYGFYLSLNGIVTGNTVLFNGSDGIHVYENCIVTGNTINYNTQNGIWASSSNTVTGNMTSFNTQDGIRVGVGNTVTDNTCNYNGYNGDGAGIHTYDYANHIEGNHVSWNDRGIDVDSYPNLIVRNSATGNTAEYDVVAGNKIAAVSTDPNTAGPWANFDF